ncbi:hypothetical protein LTR85_008284 [Meristemomyces frigidus]|nr:hypothetical protein LTR85_008284 [Meristemomyces frigidus]
MAGQPTETGLPASSSPIVLGHQAIIWISIISAIVCTTFAVVTWLLCRCSCTKRRRRRSLRTRRLSTAVFDNRNDFHHWNKALPPPGEGSFGQAEEDVRLTPLTRAAVRSAGAAADQWEQHPGEPVVVDEAAAVLAYGPRKGSRYYSGGWSLKRFSWASQIGRAY